MRAERAGHRNRLTPPFSVSPSLAIKQSLSLSLFLFLINSPRKFKQPRRCTCSYSFFRGERRSRDARTRTQKPSRPLSSKKNAETSAFFFLARLLEFVFPSRLEFPFLSFFFYSRGRVGESTSFSLYLCRTRSLSRNDERHRSISSGGRRTAGRSRRCRFRRSQRFRRRRGGPARCRLLPPP